MFNWLWKTLRYFLNYSEKECRRIRRIVEIINSYEEGMKKLSDDELRAKTGEFKQRLERGESLDEILPEAFAVVREASVRTLGLRHFDVQMIGGVVLHEGKIAEMKTGEGKTLVATLPAYLNALEGKGVHIVTVNDYLARRDSEWMGKIYNFLGLEVGLILNQMPFSQKYEAYRKDITYGTNNEFGFDYLRDNMALSMSEVVQRSHHYAIVDEVDSILIDEARTPLIISGPAEQATTKYYQFADIARRMKRDIDYQVDEKSRTVTLTEEGIAHAERLLKVDNWYEMSNIKNVHLLQQALKAKELFKLDRDYVVKDGEVLIVDEFTGRLMFGRRYSEGLHQSIEAKEGVKIVRENQTLATITLQNYFRMYKKLAGMTGTAETEAAEFLEIYKLPVVVIPTHRPMIRIDAPDVIYRTEREKFRAVIREIKAAHERKQPVLVGTVSIEKSELLGKMLKETGIPHNILNAKHHEKEAQIVAEAGKHGAVTIATNMAGRGTDIVLDEEARAAGGLYIIGTERHESRRIDNQLRGRSGRQGDPGLSRFFLSLEDDLLRLFGSDRISGVMQKLGMQEDEPIESALVTRAIESAQKRVESRNFEIRKHVLKYDDVMNKQREAFYQLRRSILEEKDIDRIMHDILEEVVENLVSTYIDFDFEDLEPGYDEFAELYYVAYRKKLDLASIQLEPERPVMMIADEREDEETVEEEIEEETDPYELFIEDFAKRLGQDGYAKLRKYDRNTLKRWKNIALLIKKFKDIFNIELEHSLIEKMKLEELLELLMQKVHAAYEAKMKEIGEETFKKWQKITLLLTMDDHWKEHLTNMDQLEEGIGLRAYGQKDPLVEYRVEGSEMFEEMARRIKEEVVVVLFKMKLKEEAAIEEKKERVMFTNRDEGSQTRTPVRVGEKVGRNEPCPCGSGKKFKKCCGA